MDVMERHRCQKAAERQCQVFKCIQPIGNQKRQYPGRLQLSHELCQLDVLKFKMSCVNNANALHAT